MDIKVLAQKLDDHIDSDNKAFANISSSLKMMSREIEMLKTNHIKHIQEDVTDLKIGLKEVKGDVKWIKGIGALLTAETLGVLVKLIFG